MGWAERVRKERGVEQPSNANEAPEAPPVTHEVVIRRDAAGGLHVSHPDDALLTLGMLEMAKVAIIEGRIGARLKAAQEPRIVPATMMPAGLRRAQ